jgi:hypothetical protein
VMTFLQPAGVTPLTSWSELPAAATMIEPRSTAASMAFWV